MRAFAAWVRGMPVLDRWVSIAALSAGVAVGIIALVLSLVVYAPRGPVGALKVTVAVGGVHIWTVANAEVTVTSASTHISARTDSAGVATFLLPPGSYLVKAPEGDARCGTTGSLAARVTVTAVRPTSVTCGISVQ